MPQRGNRIKDGSVKLWASESCKVLSRAWCGVLWSIHRRLGSHRVKQTPPVEDLRRLLARKAPRDIPLTLWHSKGIRILYVSLIFETPRFSKIGRQGAKWKGWLVSCLLGVLGAINIALLNNNISFDQCSSCYLDSSIAIISHSLFLAQFQIQCPAWYCRGKSFRRP